MRINWKVRAKNPYFWFGLIAIILASVGAKPEMFTSWAILETSWYMILNREAITIKPAYASHVDECEEVQ